MGGASRTARVRAAVAVAVGRLLDPDDVACGAAVSAALVAAELLLVAAVVRSVAYTEIDWEAYMEQVRAWRYGGVADYAQLRGGTGPLVYPGGFVLLYAALEALTDGDVAAAQPLFAALYVAGVALALGVTVRARTVPPLFLPLLCLSKRLHSIFVLRLFNDCFATCGALGAVALFQGRRWVSGSVVLSAALSVKMNVLLYAPPLAVLLLQGASPAEVLAGALAALALQLAVAAPFVRVDARAYLSRAFDFGRAFLHVWSVNFKFVPEAAFLSKAFSRGLLAALLTLLLLFAHRRWCAHVDGGLWGALRGWLARAAAAPLSMVPPPGAELLSPKHIAGVLFEGNFLGVLCSRSLHYQFYSWYYWSLPLLLWRARLPAVLRPPLLLAIEACWNVYPSTPASSAALLACHLVLLCGLMAARAAAPLPAKKAE